MQIGARVDVMGDASADDGENVGGAFSAEIEPGEEPLACSQNQSSELTLSSIVGELRKSDHRERSDRIIVNAQIGAS